MPSCDGFVEGNIFQQPLVGQELSFGCRVKNRTNMDIRLIREYKVLAVCEWCVCVCTGSSPGWTSDSWDAGRRPDLKDGYRAGFLPVWCLSESSIPGPSHTSTVRVIGCF